MTERSARLSALLESTEVHPLASIDVDPQIRAASLDSRRIEPGDLFVAVRGFREDGERYVADAVQRGATAILAASPRPGDLPAEVAWVQVAEPRRAAGLLSRERYGRPDEAMALVGVTGTNGKTTVTHLVESIAAAAGRRCGRIGTVGSSFGGQERPLARTTPEAPELYRLLAEMRDHAIEIVAMEVSSHALALSRVAGASFRVAAFLNLSNDHLDFHGDTASYFEAKATLFENLGDEAWAVLPADDPYGVQLAGRTAARTITFGRLTGAAVQLHDERLGLDGSSAVLETPSGALPVRSFLPGRVNLDNIAAAAACAIALELPPESIPQGVLELESVSGRMERVRCGQPFEVLVDYAHTPAALAQLLDWAREVAAGRLLVVFGCGGERDIDKRAVMGRVAATAADSVFLTSDNPRDEDPQAIIEQVAQGAAEVAGGPERLTRIADRADAIGAALAAAAADDVVVIAGKGHESVQVIGGVSRPFEDRQVARDALRALGFSGECGARA